MTTTTSDRPQAQAHAPELGLTHRLLGPLHVTGIFWYRLHYFAATRLPQWAMSLVEDTFTVFFWLTLGRIRRAVASNLEPVLGPAGPWTRGRRAFRTFLAFARCLTERYQRMGKAGGTTFIPEGVANWDQALAGGRGAVLVTAHIGPWESSTYTGANHERRVVHVVRDEEIDPKAQAFISKMFGRDDAAVVTHYAGDDMRLAIELSEALRRGELVALQGDRPRAGGKTVAAQIFGRPMPLPVGPAALARVSGVPLVPLFSFREGLHKGRLVIRPPITVARTADRDGDIGTATRQVAAEIEWAIRERPHQWFCFRKLW